MERNTHRGADMVRQVLTFARGGEVGRVDLRQIVTELEKIIRETFPKEVSVDVFLAKDLWSVQGNATELYQTLLNLCVNARDAMPNGGRISIAADNVELSAEEASGMSDARPGRFVSLLVADTGAGMPLEVQQRIFEPFFTTKEPGRGTGIGLSTVLRIVKGHEGFIRVESQIGQGTTFELFFPAAAEEKIAAQAQQSAPPGHGELVIVADDEEAIRQLAAEGLNANGYRALTAGNGSEAIQLFNSNLAANPILIADGSMPGMALSKLLSAVRELAPSARIIIASGQDDFGGEALTLRKPYALQELLAAVHIALNKTTTTDA
jgi:CheY-like chemotaxis protein